MARKNNTPTWPHDHSAKHSEAAKLGWIRRRGGRTAYGAREIAQGWAIRAGEARASGKAINLIQHYARQAKEWERKAREVENRAFEGTRLQRRRKRAG